MDNELKKYSKIAKGKEVFSTQLRSDLYEELKEVSKKTGVPITILTERFLEYGLHRLKETGMLPLDPKGGTW